MTAGRSCIDSSTPSVTAPLMSCSTPSTSSLASPPSFHAPAPISPDTTACSPRTSSTATASSPTLSTNAPASLPRLVARPCAGCSGSSASSTSTSNTVACVVARCPSSRASKRPNSSRPSSPISPRARPAASITPAHHRSMRLSPHPRTPHLRPCPDCARRCTTARLRLASRALRSPAPSGHAFIFAGSKSHHLNPDSFALSALAPTSNPTTTGPILPQPSQSTPYSSYPLPRRLLDLG